MLQTVLDKGTGGSARWKYNFYHPAGGKTGTTQNWTDAWFVGFSKQIAAGVWMGVDDPCVSLGEGQDISKQAEKAWNHFDLAQRLTRALPKHCSYLFIENPAFSEIGVVPVFSS